MYLFLYSLPLFSTNIAQVMPQFPPGFQGASLPQFAGNTGNFGTFRPQFSVPGQQNSNFNQVCATTFPTNS